MSARDVPPFEPTDELLDELARLLRPTMERAADLEYRERRHAQAEEEARARAEAQVVTIPDGRLRCSGCGELLAAHPLNGGGCR